MYNKTVLPNGIRILTEQIPGARSVTLGVWFEVGSRNENEAQHGFSHFIEHLLFKGSMKYSARDIAELIEGVGGTLNAFTGKEYTCYYASVLDQDLPLVIDILEEMVLRPQFAPAEFERERNVILEEIKACEDVPEDLVHDLFCAQLWPEHSLGRTIVGTIDSIGLAKRTDVIDYYQKHYVCDKLIIAAAGNVQHQTLVEQIAAAFAPLPSASKSKEELSQPVAAQQQVVCYRKPLEQVHLCFGGPAISRFDHRHEALRLLDLLIGGGMSSRLFQELREMRGLVYNVYSDYAVFRDVGEYVIYAACSQENYEQVVDVIRDQLSNLVLLPITDGELQRIKGHAKGNLVLALENTMNRMVKLIRDEESFGRIISVDETLQAIDAVTATDLQLLAQEIITPEKWILVSLGLA